MIKTDAQLERTKTQLEGFRAAVKKLTDEGPRAEIPAEVLPAVIASHEGMIAKLAAEVEEYEDLRREKISLPLISTLVECAAHLAKFRIAQGITQESLAVMVDVTRQTINKHEEQAYQLASLDFVSRVLEALGVIVDVSVSHRTLTVMQPSRRRPTQQCPK